MTIREATPNDFEGIVQCVASTAYYNPVEPRSMGGRWLVAYIDGELAGCVWLMAEAPNAYIDFLAVSPKHQNGLGVSLMGAVQHWLVEHGIKYARSAIRHSNMRALRLALAFGSKLDSGYAMLYWQGVPDGN